MGKKDIVEKIARFFSSNKNRYHIIRMGIFGSVARNEMTDDSDVDVVVELEKPSMFDLIGIKQDLEEDLNRRVDVVRYREKMNRFLKRRIEREAVYV
jgi:predicted nucleotidyltransferase